MGPPLGVPLAHDLVRELARRLLGHPEVGGRLRDGRAVRGEPGERETVRGPQPFEAARDNTGMNALRQLTRDGEQGGEIPAGTRAPLHTVSREEIFHLLSGELLITLDGRPERITAGDTVIVNPGVALGVENPTGEVAVSWVTTSIGLEAKLADGTRIAPPWAR